MPAISHDRHALAQLAYLGHTMGDPSTVTPAGLKPCDLSAEPFDVGNGQGRGRLVQQQQVRPPCHCFRDLELLPRRQIKFGNESIRIDASNFQCSELLHHARAAPPVDRSAASATSVRRATACSV